MTTDERQAIEFDARVRHIVAGRATAIVLVVSIIASLIASLF